MKEANIRDGTPALIADISIRGLWEPQAVALLDVRVVDTDAPSHIHWNTVAVLSLAEEEKKQKYNSAAEARRASFFFFFFFFFLLYLLMECRLERRISY